MMEFDDALNLVRAGTRVARAGWNGKGMWLFLVKGEDYLMPHPEGVAVHALGCERLPWIAMKTADNKIVPWLASQTDLLADDWMAVT